MKRYLKTVIYFETQDQLSTIINELLTMIDREPIVDDQGDSYIEILSDKELLDESFCLGMIYRHLEINHGIKAPFEIQIVELENPPIGIEL